MKITHTLAALAATTIAVNAATIWQEDWDTVGSNTTITDSSFDITDVQDVEVVSGNVRNFNHNNRGGFDLIPTGGGDITYTMTVELLDTTYVADTEYTLHYIIGTGASSGLTGNWFVEFGTISGGVFTSLSGSNATGSLTLNDSENFQDPTNPTTTFGGDGVANFGGRELSYDFDPNAVAEGQNVAIRFGTTLSSTNAGFSDLLIETTPVPEPSSTALLGLGGLALILRRRK